MSTTEPVRVLSGLATLRVALNAVTATLVIPKDAPAVGPAQQGFREIKNIDAAITVYIGPAGVTALTGFPIPAGASYIFAGAGRIFVGDLYAIAASGTPSVATLVY